MYGRPVDELIDLAREELAVLVVVGRAGANFNARNEVLTAREVLRRSATPALVIRRFEERLGSAITWLQAEGYLVANADQSDTWDRVTSDVAELSLERVRARRQLGILALADLHPDLTEARSIFRAGELDTAVFSALRAVEERVRRASGLPKRLVGTDLMRQAFKVADGPLTDPEQLPAEQQALSDLFAGTIGWAKNPRSHRSVDVADDQAAAELILLANHLLRIVDATAAGTAASGSDEASR